MADLTATTVGLSPSYYYRLYDVSGNVATDYLGNSNGSYAAGFTLNQAPLTSNDAGSAVFNGTTGHAILNIQPNDAVFANPSFSVSVFVNPSAITTTQVCIIGGVSGAANGWQMLISSQYVIFNIRNGATFSQAYATLTVTNGGLYHCVGVADSATNQKAYANGAVGGNTATYQKVAPQGYQPWIGNDAVQQNIAFAGTVAEVSLYNYALSAAQVSSLYGARAVVGVTTIATPPTPIQATKSPFIPIGFYARDLTDATYTSTGATDVSGTSQQIFQMNCVSNKVRFFYTNFSSNSTESTAFSALTIQSSIQVIADNGTPVQLTFGGANSVALGPGQSVWTDWYNVPGNLAKNQYVAVRTYATWPSLGIFPQGSPALSGNQVGYFASGGNNYAQHTTGNGSNQLLTAGAASAWTSSSSSSMFQPVSMDGYAIDGISRAVVALAGDSIMYGVTDNSDGTGGAAVRGMVINGTPYFQIAHPGETVAIAIAGDGYSHRLQRADRATVIIDEYGTNDLNNASTFSTLRTNKLVFWQMLGRNGTPVIPVTLLPRTSGTFAATTAQTVNTNAAAYQSYNAWLRAPYASGAGVSARYDAAQVGVTIPGIIDAASYVETVVANTAPGGPSAPSTGNLWYCGPGNNVAYTNDGVHPILNSTLAMVPAFTGVAAIINATAPVASTTSVAIGGSHFIRRF